MCLSLLLSCSILTACGDKSEPLVVTKPVIVDNKPAKSDMTCAPEPKPGRSIKTDIDLSIWNEAVRKAGSDCRGKLDAIRRTFYPGS